MVFEGFVWADVEKSEIVFGYLYKRVQSELLEKKCSIWPHGAMRHAAVYLNPLGATLLAQHRAERRAWKESCSRAVSAEEKQIPRWKRIQPYNLVWTVDVARVKGELLPRCLCGRGSKSLDENGSNCTILFRWWMWHETLRCDLPKESHSICVRWRGIGISGFIPYTEDNKITILLLIEHN
jgi:hypothetical protein